MEEKRYIISEAAEKTGIEAHVLRYWEEELGLDIPRNEMGHRFYTEKQLQLFRQIKELKESGFQLKAVKTVLEGSDGNNNTSGAERDTRPVADVAVTVAVPEGQELVMKRSEDKLAQFEQIIGDIVTRSLMANNSRLGEDISSMVTDQVSNKVIKEMDYMMRVREEAEDDRFKKLDETIRGMQRSNKEAAVYRQRHDKKEKKKLFFGKSGRVQQKGV